MTKGEYRVGITFNPSNDDKVGKIKRLAADLIDMIDDLPLPNVMGHNSAVHSGEIGRLKSLAQTNVEDAAMWAVKAATKPAYNA